MYDERSWELRPEELIKVLHDELPAIARAHGFDYWHMKAHLIEWMLVAYYGARRTRHEPEMRSLPRETAASDERVRAALGRFYARGTLECEDALRIALGDGKIHLYNPRFPPAAIAFSERAFMDLVRKTGVQPTDQVVRLLLCVIYYDPVSQPWVRRIGLHHSWPRCH